MKPPSETELVLIERKLRQLPPGAQRKVTEGVYMRLERSSGKRRFTYRGLNGRPGGTRDTWREAHDARDQLENGPLEPAGDPLEMTQTEQRQLTFRRYYRGVYVRDALMRLDVTTRSDYSARMERDVLPHIGDYTMEEMQERPGLMILFKEKVAEGRKFPKGHRRAGQIPVAGCNESLKVASSVFEHAVKAGVLYRNPLRGISRFSLPRTRGGNGGSSYRQVEAESLMRPEMIALVGLGMRGEPARLLGHRLKPVLIATGWRPQDLGAARWRAVRNQSGPLRRIRLEQALKDIRGHLIVGEPKRGARKLYQFAVVGELLDQLYAAQGCPSLDDLIFPNTFGDYQDWGNWRDEVWYPSLCRAGVADAPNPRGDGAFDPYTLRHVGITTMLACRRHDALEGRYSPAEVARQFGNGVETLHKVYHHVLDDPLNVATKTMDEVIRAAFRDVWGTMPRDDDYQQILLSLPEAADFTGLTIKSLEGRIRTGRLPVAEPHPVRARSRVSEFDLVWAGLVDPTQRRVQPGRDFRRDSSDG